MTAPAYNTVSWFQVGSDDPEGVKRFYGDLFGWNFTPDPNGGGKYDLVGYPGADRPNGGIAHTDAAQNHAIFLVVVEDVAAVVTRTERIGGKVLVPPTTGSDGLIFADLLDPSGNHFGVFSPPPAG